MVATSPIFKKALSLELEKYFGQMVKICEGVYMGTFSTRSLLSEYVVVIKNVEGRQIKVCLGSNEYALFDQILANFKFLLE